jgi:hypothetical protein
VVKYRFIVFVEVNSGGFIDLEVDGGGVDRSSSILVIRYFMRSFRRLVPGAEIGQCGVNGRPDRLYPSGRKSSLMANFEDR